MTSQPQIKLFESVQVPNIKQTQNYVAKVTALYTALKPPGTGNPPMPMPQGDAAAPLAPDESRIAAY